jgi:HEAT repeat protein
MRNRLWTGMLLFSISASLAAQAPPPTPWQILQQGTSSGSAKDRAAAVRALGLLRNEPAAAGLAETALRDPSADVRSAAATALGEMRATHSADKIAALLADKNVAVVLAAAHALLQLKDRRGYDVYYALLTGQRKTGTELLESQTRVLKDPRKLAHLGFEQGIGFVPFGGIGYGAYKMFTKDEVSPVRADAAETLADDPDPSTLDALAAAVKDKSWLVRVAAIAALARRNDPKALEAVRPALTDAKSAVRFTAAAAVLRLTPRPRPAPPASKK